MRRLGSWSGRCVAALVLVTAAAGCGSQRHEPPPQPSIYAGLPLRGTPGERVFEHTGCAACHRIGRVGNDGPGPRLTHVGARMSRRELLRTLDDPRAPMPSFRNLTRAEKRALVGYLSRLR